MSAVFLVGVSVLLLAGAIAVLRSVPGVRRVDLVAEVVIAVPLALPARDVLVAAPKTSPPG